MTEQLQESSNWEVQRRTGRFAAEPESTAEANSWLEMLDLPPVMDETYKDWADRTAEERRGNDG
jgi:hypothetical protein